jgi:hypothetical protein
MVEYESGALRRPVPSDPAGSPAPECPAVIWSRARHSRQRGGARCASKGLFSWTDKPPPGIELLGRTALEETVLDVFPGGTTNLTKWYPVGYTKNAWFQRERLNNDLFLAHVILHEMAHHAGATHINRRTPGDADWVADTCLGASF